MAFDLYSDWPEMTSGLLLVIGFILAVSARNAFLVYLLVVCTGFLLGRIWFRMKKGEHVTLFMISCAILFGLLLGSLKTDAAFTVLLFFGSNVLSFWFHEKKYVESLEF